MRLSKSPSYRGFLFFAALVSVLLASSCARWRSSKQEVWARVDGTPIYRSQVEAAYRRREPVLPGADKAERTLSFKLNILNELIDRQILLERATQQQITVSDKEVDARLAQIRSPYSDDDFRKELARQGLTSDDLRQQIRNELTIQKLIQKEITSRVVVTQEEIASYYARNKADFNVPQTEYHLAQILVTPVPDPQIRNLLNDDARNPNEAQRKIKALYALLRSGEDFAKVAEQFSEDPRTAQGGGDMGFIPESSLNSDRVVSKALKSLRPGQFSGILRDRNGFRIIKLLGKIPAGQRQLSDPQVQNSIRQTLSSEKAEVLKSAYIENLRNQAHVVDYLAQRIVEAAGSAKDIR
ncbi:MAG TPA: SurA N-terminal domain-containing protein [Terriglobia bacterium]|nr:SurA N-terminal domain-containing protein [Terriglobia bacterium]